MCKRNILKSIIIMLFLSRFIAISFAAGTGKISGTITDAQSGEPLPGVNVLIAGTSMGGATDLQGNYFILNVPVGVYTLEASMIGYTKINKTEVFVSIDRISRVDFALEISVIEGQEITVVAEKDILHREVSSSQQIITENQITEAPGIHTVGEFLAKQVGITDAENLSVRGGAPDQTLAMVNGISYVDSRLGRAESSIPLSAIEQISVVSGGFNAEYGNFRSGLVNITTKKGSKEGYHGRLDFTGNIPHQKHYGPSTYDTQNYYLRPFLDPDVAFVGTETAWADDPYTKQQYDSFIGWNSLAESFNSGKAPEDQATPLDLYMWTAWMFMVEPDFNKLESLGYDFSVYQDNIKQVVLDHAHEKEGENSDWNFDGGFGGPIPVIGKALGDATFYLSHNNSKTHYVQPVIRPAENQNVTMLNINSNLSSNYKLSLDALYREVKGVTGFVRGNRMSLSSAGLMSTRNAGEGADRYLWYPTYFHGKNVYTTMLGASLNHVISQRTFWDLHVNMVHHADRVRTIFDRDETILARFGPIPLDERPYTNSGGYTELDGFGFDEYERPIGITYRWANKNGMSYDNSNTYQYRLRFDLSSQVNNYNLMKSGFELNYTDINNVLQAIRIGHPEDAGENSFNRSPIQAGLYVQDQITFFESLLANIGVRFDYYHSGGDWPSGDIYSEAAFAGGGAMLGDEDPFDAYASGREMGWDYLNLVNEENPGLLEPIKDQYAISPRIGLSFPVTDRSKFYFNYGHFRSLAPYITLFSHHSNPARGEFTMLGNPNLEPPRTISYELGGEYNLMDMALIRLSTYYKDVTGQHGEVDYIGITGAVDYTSYLNNQYEDIQGFELVVSKTFGRWVTGWLNWNYMMQKRGLTGREEFYEDPSKSAFFGLYEGQESRFLARPRLTANIMLHTPLDWGPSIAGHKALGGIVLSVLPTWQAGEYFDWNPLGKFHLNDNLQWPAYHVWDIKIEKAVKIGSFNLEGYCTIRNLFDNHTIISDMAFSGGTDERNYFSSLQLPMYDSPEFDGLRQANPGKYIAGDDHPGMLRSDKSYINDPDIDLFMNGNHPPRDIWFGLRLIF